MTSYWARWRLKSLASGLFAQSFVQRKHQSSASFVRGIHIWPVDSPHKRPVARKMFPVEVVIMYIVPLNRWDSRTTFDRTHPGVCTGGGSHCQEVASGQHQPLRVHDGTAGMLIYSSVLYFGGLVQDCSNSSAIALELLQSCNEPSI